MGQTVRLSTPGNDVLTDTNLDHYSLYADADNILIKEKSRGTFSLSSGTQTVAHNLGYIPDFKVFVNDQSASSGRYGWKAIPAQNSALVVADYWAEADGTNMYVVNNVGSSTAFAYYIFYDNQVGSSAGTITQSNIAFKVSKQGNNAGTSTNPNDYIFHSDVNTFKILKEGTAAITYTANDTYTINHGLSLSNPTSFDLFLKFPDGYAVKCAGFARTNSRDANWSATDTILTTSQIKTYITRYAGADTAISAKYYIYETPLAGTTGITITQSDHLLRVSKAGKNALTATDPDDYIFLSGYNTLKYSFAGSTTITIVGDGSDKTTEVSVAHELLYTPYFTCFVDDFVNFPDQRYALAPYSNNTISLTRQSEVYIDGTNIYLKMFNTSSNTYTGKFYYKVYKNNLGI